MKKNPQEIPNDASTHSHTRANKIESLDMEVHERRAATPFFLFHVTTGKKAKLYRQTGQINGPVRGFDTLQAAMAWAMKVGRKVIMRVEPVSPPQMLPDHHNDYGRAWWTDTVPMSRVKCAYSAEGAWALPPESPRASLLCPRPKASTPEPTPPKKA